MTRIKPWVGISQILIPTGMAYTPVLHTNGTINYHAKTIAQSLLTICTCASLTFLIHITSLWINTSCNGPLYK